VAAQTVVDSVRVTVVAGIVYTPGVGQVVANGVGTTGAGELEAFAVVLGGGGGGGAEVDLGVIPITRSHVSLFSVDICSKIYSTYG
jgi:hypothetical protein